MRTAHVALVYELPLVPNLYEVKTRGSVTAALGRLGDQRGVEYAQPNYIETESLDAAPSQAAYWPNDPYFWPTNNANIDDCTESRVLSGWQLWPQGVDLTTAGTAAQQFNPLAAAQRSVGPPDTSRFVNYLSANVMPVWNLLDDQHRLDGPGAGGWTEQELRRFGIAIDDTGISGHPDLQTQVAALFSVVQSEEIEGSQVTTRDRVREVFRDNAHRDDLGALRAAIKGFGDNGPQVQFVGRPLFTLDDPNVLSAKDWEPTNQETGVHSSHSDVMATAPQSRRSPPAAPTTASASPASATTFRSSLSAQACRGTSRGRPTRPTVRRISSRR